MLRVASSFKDYEVEASDGHAGTVHDLLFDDVTWKLRWLVVDSGDLLNRRRVLIHPSFIGRVDAVGSALQVKLPRATIAAAPGLPASQSVSLETEASLYDYYNWDPSWGRSVFGTAMSPNNLDTDLDEEEAAEPEHPYRAEYQHPHDHESENGVDGLGVMFATPDPHLCSLSEVTRYHIDANDGSIGHLEDVLIDDAEWLIHYLVVNTSNWWMGRQVLISPYAVDHIEFAEQTVKLNLSQDKIRESPPWDQNVLIEAADRARLHQHYEWPDYWEAANSKINKK